MRVLCGAEAEHALQVFDDEFAVLVLLDHLQDSVVDSLLVGLALLIGHILGLLGGENIGLAGLLLLVQDTSEVLVVEVLWNLVLAQVQAGLAGNHVSL